MAKFSTVEDFKKYKPLLKKPKVSLLIGMGTCGIAAGAKKVQAAFENEILNRNLKDIEIKSVGCLGLCFSEPNVEVIVEGMPNVLYAKVDAELAKEIISTHVVHKSILEKNIIDKPYIDIYKN